MMMFDFDSQWRDRSIERLTAVYQGRIPDRVPGYTVEDFPMPEPAKMFHDPQLQFEYQIEKLRLQQENGMDVVPGVCPTPNCTFFPSLFGAEIVFPQTDSRPGKPYYERSGEWPRVKHPPLNDIRQVNSLEVPDIRKKGQGPMLIRTLQFFKKVAQNKINVGIFCCDGPLYLAWELLGEKLMLEFYDHPDEVRKLLNLCADTIIEVTRLQKEIVEEPLDACYFTCDDVYIPKGFGGLFIGLTHAAMLSPEIYREFVRPYDEKVFNAFGGGAIHTCGNHAHLFEEFSTLPISMMRFYAGAYEPRQAKVTVGKTKVILGVRASALGGAVPDTDDLVETLRQCKTGGRFILGPNGSRSAVKQALQIAGRY
jgi:hypothetical protein